MAPGHKGGLATRLVGTGADNSIQHIRYFVKCPKKIFYPPSPHTRIIASPPEKIYNASLAGTRKDTHMKRRLPYQNPTLPVERRVNDLLRRMRPREKIAQMLCMGARNHERQPGHRFDMRKVAAFCRHGMGSSSLLLRKFRPRRGAEVNNLVQRHLREKTRLGIPLLNHDEGLHGCMAKGGTIFPQSIAMAATWDPELVRRTAYATGREMRSRGIANSLSPTINIARDARCGRVEETYGEDPLLAAGMGVAHVRGMQSAGVAPTLKHFAANFVGDGGRDSYPIHLSERLLREVYFPAFRACVSIGGPMAVMAAYNSLDGRPCNANPWLLRRLLKGEWRFTGFVMSDYWALQHLWDHHHTAADLAQAAVQAVAAGVDTETPWPIAFEHLERELAAGRIACADVDDAVRRILRVKMHLGLFENPYADPDEAERVNDCAQHRELAREACRASVVLLRNERSLLPLSRTIRRIAVIGPNAATVRTGGYSGSGVHTVSVLEGIGNIVGKDADVRYAEGCTVKGTSRAGIAHAIRAARKSDVAVVAVGNHSDLWINQDASEGEGNDRSSLELPGVQEELIQAVAATGTPVVVVLISGGPVIMERWLSNVHAVLHAWYPGEEGGNAIAEILFGLHNPSGKLPITFPKRTAQCPLYYAHKPTGRVDDYIDLRGAQERFPFGFGLGYTAFEHRILDVTQRTARDDGRVRIRAEVRNTGRRAGEEVVQVYLRDTVSSLARPERELCAFQRVRLEPGERLTVEFELERQALAYLDEELRPVVEPGDFEVFVGADSTTTASAHFLVR